MEFSYYLFQKDIKSVEDVFQIQPLPEGYEVAAVHEAFAPAADDVQVKAFVRRGEPKVDGGWKAFVSTHFEVDDDVLASRTPSAVVFVCASDRLFAIPFGFGRFAIPDDLIEQDFGIATSLNRLKGTKLTRVKVVTPGTRRKSTTIERNYEGEVSELASSRASDILSEVGGKTPHGDGESRISGSQALRFADAATLEELIENCRTTLDWYTTDEPEDDELATLTSAQQVKDQGTIDRLIERLHKMILSDEGDIDVSINDPDWRDLPPLAKREFKIGRADWVPVNYEFDMSWFRIYWKVSNFAYFDLPEPLINIILEDSNNVKVSPLRLMSAVVLTDNAAFYLEDGRWYRTSRQFVNNVDTLIGQVEDLPVGALPDFDGKVHFVIQKGKQVQSEGAYNANVGTLGNHTNCDLPAMRYRQETEVCDLLSNTNEFIHLKRGVGFGSVSYVTAQAFVSVDRLCGDDPFRVFAAGLSATAAWIAQPNWDRRNIKVVVCLISKQAKDTAASLSFNGRMILARLSEDCHRLGVKLAYVRVRDVT